MGAKAPHNFHTTNEVGGKIGRMKKTYRKTPHTVYDIKYHFVFCPKYRYEVLQESLKARLEEIISEICEAMEIKIEEGKICKDHVHMCLSVPPRYSPAEVMKRVKGRSSERVFREFPKIRERYWGEHFWARGYFVSTVGIDEETIKKYIASQERVPTSEEQLKLWK